MGMTFGTMIVRVQGGCGNGSEDFKLTIKKIINEQRRIKFRKLHPKGKFATYELPLVAETEEYTLSSSVGYILSARGSDGREIRAMNENQFQSEYAKSQTTEGDPTIIRVWGRDATTGGLKVKVYTIPESGETAKLNVAEQPTTLVNDEDESEMDEGFDDTVVSSSISKACLANRKPNDALAAHSIAKADEKDFIHSDENIQGEDINQFGEDPFVTQRRDEW